MKKIFKSFVVLAALSLAACTDFVDPSIPYSDFDTGVYLRTLQAPATSFVFTELAASTFRITVEAVDIEDGRTVQEVDVFVARRRGPSTTPEAKLLTIPASAFQTGHGLTLPDVHPASGSKYPATTIEVTVPEALVALGLPIDSITGGDFFEFRLELRDNRGRTFTNTNLSPDIQGGLFYRSPFFYRIPVVCVSNLAGTYDMTTVGWCGNTYEGKVRFVVDPDEATNYTIEVDLDGEFTEDFSFGAYRACYGAATLPATGSAGLRFTDACNQVDFNEAPSSYGDLFTLNSASVAGPVLTLDYNTNWNTSAGLEGGVVTITRTDGTNWPPLRK